MIKFLSKFKKNKVNKLKVKSIKRLTDKAVEVTFITNGTYIFNPGQYINITANINGSKVKRSYSISSSSSRLETISVGVKQVEKGLMSTYLNNSLKVGDELEVSLPEGNFNINDLNKTAIMVCAGSGITPIMSMLMEMLPSGTNVSLIYSNTSIDSTMYQNELNDLAINFDNFTILNHYTNQLPRLTPESITEYIKGINNYSKADVYICGPNELISNASIACNSLNITSVFKEYFTEKDEKDRVSESVSVGQNDELKKGEIANVKIKYEGRNYEFECKYDEKILDAALDADIEPPYSCLVAACCTCRAMVKHGEINMIDKDSLTQKDIEKGYVLTCQSQPRSKNIYLDYDE